MYLGYVLKSNGKSSVYVKHLAKKANVMMRLTWGIGERIFKEDENL